MISLLPPTLMRTERGRLTLFPSQPSQHQGPKTVWWNALVVARYLMQLDDRIQVLPVSCMEQALIYKKSGQFLGHNISMWMSSKCFKSSNIWEVSCLIYNAMLVQFFFLKKNICMKIQAFRVACTKFKLPLSIMLTFEPRFASVVV